MSPDDEREQPRVAIGTVHAVVPTRWLRILLVTVLAIVATAAVLAFVPRTYESTARLMLEAGSDDEAATSARVESQVELLTSRDLLLRVVDLQNLRSVPEFASVGFSPLSALMRLIGQGAATRNLDDVVIANLADRMSVGRERESSVVSVTVHAGDAELAASIANAVARAHVEGWAARQASEQAGATTRLNQEIESLRARVSAADAAVASYKLENGLADTPVALPPTDALSGAAAQIAEAQQRKASASSRAEVIRGLLASGKPLDGVPDIRESAMIGVLLQSKASLEAELTQKHTTLLPNHPTIKALKSQINQLNGSISEEAARIAESLEAEATVAADREQRLRQQAASDKATGDGTAQTAVNLESLEREARTQRDLLDSYLAKYADLSAANDAGSGRQDIRVISDATPALEPSSPKYLLIMGAVGFGVLALQVAAALLGRAAAPLRRDSDHDQQELAAFVAEPEVTGEGDDTDDLLERAIGQAISSAGTPRSSIESALPDLFRALDDQGIVLLVSVGEGEGVVQVVERLLEDALMAQFSAVIIDAASGITSDVAGLTDLAAGVCDYGAAVQPIDDNLAEVRWGRVPTLDRRSTRPLTMAEALADLYHLVVVDTGRAGMTSSLPLFAGLPAAVVLVANGDAD
ncbi:GumC family protein, partial [Devosia sp.]|uniref:GumC family protein n=1 Tax=Devosia sp. TaxID=1871048 RepID=UPI001AC1E8DB